MALYSQIAHLPVLFQVEAGGVRKLAKYLDDKNLFFKRVLVVSGASFSANVAKTILNIPELKDWNHIVVDSNSMKEAERLQAHVFQNPVDLLVAVGGGKVLDVVKRVSLLQRVNHLAVPTIISNDGIASPISVLRVGDGKTKSVAGQMPIGVVIDTEIVLTAPHQYWQAAAGDILSNASATNDWLLARDQWGEQINDAAYEMSLLSVNAALNIPGNSLESPRCLRQIIHSLLCSGIAMGIAGSSQPCSGSEHMISHAIDFLDLSPNTLHGLQVGSISLFTLHLQDKLTREVLDFANSWNLPKSFAELSPEVGRNLNQVLQISREMRPGRYTVLDNFEVEELVNEYQRFAEQMQ